MVPDFTIGDGTDRAVRQCQLDVFEHLCSTWNTHDIHVLGLPPGSGKSYIARTIQRAVPYTAILTTSNLLVDQYCSIYKQLVPVKGRDYYEDPLDYFKARKLVKTRPGCFNPLSFYYYHLLDKKGDREELFPRVIIIDEAHTLAGLLLLTISKSFSCKNYAIPTGLNDVGFLAWLEKAVKRLELVNFAKSPKLLGSYETFKILHDYLSKHLKTVDVVYEMLEDFKGQKTMHISIKPLTVPTALIKTIFRDAKLLLMSGSITPFHVEELFPSKKLDYINYEPLAPVENRPIYHKPIDKEIRRNPQALAKAILAVYEAAGRPNTLVHVSYSMGDQIKQYMPREVLTHVSLDKQFAIDQFKRKGGIILASGMAEGIDLPGDLCRLIIIPVILFPNLGAPAVIKRKAMPNGDLWYSITTAMTTLQQIGRGVRSAEDRCDTVVLDPYFRMLIGQTKNYLTKGFLDSIRW